MKGGDLDDDKIPLTCKPPFFILHLKEVNSYQERIKQQLRITAFVCTAVFFTSKLITTGIL
ncbi:MAG: hypothetical protein CVU51_11230 [Deltaproteobacteria bacterium HGW-Deltaproteobacteria-1]|jgi:hypothetical protein|nr:MAG: hypothetical protein CVU51_11230 [Deltaproteobacteria bacterium HGW-Deltaproteobacteria-1]